MRTMANDNAPSQLTKLLAFDAEDLAVISAAFQDAIVRVKDLAYLPRERRFALVGVRVDWVAAQHGRRERLWAGLHFDCVRKVAHHAIPRDNPDAALNLLAIGYTPGDPPSGEITLTFSGGGAIRLDVECIDAQMRDTGPRWRCRALPGHCLDDVPLSSVEAGAAVPSPAERV
jgi:hypothetical protein